MRLIPALLFCYTVILTMSCHKGSEQLKHPPSDWFYMQRAFPNNKLDYKAYQNALSSVKQNITLRSSREGYNDPWQMVGATNINGRITDIEMPMDNMNIIYAGTASGGIFKSTNQGNSWIPIFDDALSLSIGDMALSPSNNDIIYVGTGEANAGGGSIAYDGIGVYRSLDAGASWTYLGLEDVGSIGKVVIHPENPDIVYIAAMGRLFGNNQERGVYKTNDGGTTWEQVLFISDRTGAIDLALNPDNPETVYAAMWQRERRPFNRSYGGEDSGIYRSEDGGNTWQELTAGLPDNEEEKGRIGIAISPSNPNVLYTMYAKRDGTLQGVYKTEDGGDSWTEKSKRAITDVPYIWWFGKVFVHPSDEDMAYATSLDMFRTRDGGDNWFPIFEGAHVDHHALFIHPQNPELVINGNDGGVYISQDGGRTYDFKNSIPNLQFYTCAIDNTDPNKIFGGTQDNGTLGYNQTENIWDKLVGGDGFRVMSDPNNPDIIFAEFQNGNLRKSTDGGRSFSTAKRGTSGPANWNTPYIFDPNNSNIMYYGTNVVFKSYDQSDTWEPITGDIPITPVMGNLTFGTITSLAVSPINDAYLFVGTDDGQVAFLNQDSGNLSEINTGLPQRWITALAADPRDENNIYITLSGFRFDESGSHVFKSENLGEEWKDISSNLPDIPVNDIIVDPAQSGLLYVATDVGVFYSEDDGDSWQLLGKDLPISPITDIDFHLDTRKLAAASYGRSIYTYDLPFATSVKNNLQSNITVYPNPSSEQLHVKGLIKQSLVKIFDVNGKLQFQTFASRDDAVQTKELQPGVYFMIVNNEVIKFLKI